MTDKDYTALESELRASTRDIETGEQLYPGSYAALTIEDADRAADAIADLRRERDEARAETERQYEENVARIAEEGAAILRAEAAETECARLRARLWPNSNFGPRTTAEIAVFVEEERKADAEIIEALRVRLAAVEGAALLLLSEIDTGTGVDEIVGATGPLRAALQEPQT